VQPALGADPLAERVAAGLLHHEEQHAGEHEHVDRGDEVRVLEQAQRVGLAREPCGDVAGCFV
jgi:hypothetical protein